MGILRLSHVEVGVDDLEMCAAYYVEVLGLVEVAREPGRVYLKCWDEHDHHSVVLKDAPGGGLGHLSFKVEREEDLSKLERAAETWGCAVERVAAGEELGQGEAVRFEAPSGHRVELVHRMEKVGGLLSRTNPLPIPFGLAGVHPPRLERVYVTAEEVGEAARFFGEALGFRLTERVVADDGHLLAAWLERSHTPCDLAIVPGPNGGLHHFAFRVDDGAEVLRAADVFACHGIYIEAGPVRSGATRSHAVHALDPAGHGNAVFAGGYRPDPDDDQITWTEEEMGRAFFYPHPAMYAGFLQTRKV